MHFVSDLDFAFSISSNRKHNINCVIIYRLDLESRTFVWPVQPLHMYRRIVMSYNLVTETNTKIAHSKRVLLATVPDRQFRTGCRSDPDHCPIGGPGCQYT